jgi:hypothetical protein
MPHITEFAAGFFSSFSHFEKTQSVYSSGECGLLGCLILHLVTGITDSGLQKYYVLCITVIRVLWGLGF